MDDEGVSRRRRLATAHESGRTMSYGGVGLRRRRRTQDVAQTIASLKQLNSLTPVRYLFLPRQNNASVVAALSVLSGHQNARSIQRSKSYIDLSQPPMLSGRRAYLTRQLGLHPFQHTPVGFDRHPIRDPTPARRSHSCEKIRLGGRLNADTRLLVPLKKHIALLALSKKSWKFLL